MRRERDGVQAEVRRPQVGACVSYGRHSTRFFLFHFFCKHFLHALILMCVSNSHFLMEFDPISTLFPAVSLGKGYFYFQVRSGHFDGKWTP